MSGVIINPSVFATEAITVVDLVDDFGGDWDDWLYYYGVTSPEGNYQLNVPAGDWEANRMGVGNSSAIIQGAGMGETNILLSTLNSQGDIPGGGTGPAARIETVSAGSTTVTVKDPYVGQMDLFVEGWWTQVTGWACMTYGYPPNMQYFDYRRIADVTGDVITLDEPLTYSYQEDWPVYQEGDFPPEFASDCGGPGTVVPMNNRNTNYEFYAEMHADRQPWDQRLIMRDLTIVNSTELAQYWFGGGKSILWERCEFAGFSGTASTATDWTFRECVWTGNTIEIDKMVVELAFYDCTYPGGAGVNVQSSSVEHMTIDGCTFGSTGFARLGAKTFDVSNTTLPYVGIGPSSFGASESGTITNCSALAVSGTFFRHCTALDYATIVDGVITIPYANVSNQTPGQDIYADITPGTACVMTIGAQGQVAKCFNVLEVHQVGSDVLYTTDLPSSIPELSITGLNKIGPHPCPSITISGCTGALGPLNGHVNEPAFSRATWVMTGGSGSSHGSPAWGNIVSITVAVSQAYTGVHSTVKMCPLGQFGVFILYDGAHNVVPATQYQPMINLKVAGTRVISPGSTTGTQSGDSITTLPAGDNWFLGNDNGPGFGHINNGSLGSTLDISGEDASVRPIVTITIICDQGL